MLILTWDSYNDNDGNLNDLVGIFPDLESLTKHIEENYGVEFTSFEDLEEDSESDVPGAKMIYISEKYWDNGWGGRYFRVWQTT